jgi:hypothetical protein
MKGSTMDAMSEAIDGAECFLFAVSLACTLQPQLRRACSTA